MKKEGQSFSDVIVSNLKVRPKTCGELLQELERDFQGVQLLDPALTKAVREGRGRRSSRRPAKG
jgi:predicted CopG family antitoxin